MRDHPKETSFVSSNTLLGSLIAFFFFLITFLCILCLVCLGIIDHTSFDIRHCSDITY